MQRYDSESNSQLKVNRTPRTVNIRKNLCNLPFFAILIVFSRKRRKKHIFYFIVHSLIAFENRIRLSADSLILSADTLIVAELMIRKTEAKRIHSPLSALFSCRHVVTLSHFHYNKLETCMLRGWQQRDNKIKTQIVATRLNSCLSIRQHFRDNVTTKQTVSLVEEKNDNIPCSILCPLRATHIRR